jgi:hypothetical protein
MCSRRHFLHCIRSTFRCGTARPPLEKITLFCTARASPAMQQTACQLHQSIVLNMFYPLLSSLCLVLSLACVQRCLCFPACPARFVSVDFPESGPRPVRSGRHPSAPVHCPNGTYTPILCIRVRCMRRCCRGCASVCGWRLLLPSLPVRSSRQPPGERGDRDAKQTETEGTARRRVEIGGAHTHSTACRVTPHCVLFPVVSVAAVSAVRACVLRIGFGGGCACRGESSTSLSRA